MNSANLIGFLGKDAEVKAAQDNSTNFTVLSLATKESWKNKQPSEWESRTEWHRILVFGKLGDFAATLTKGAHIEVEGTLRSREQTLELKGSSKKNPETKNVRSWFIRAESIRKLDRAENSAQKPITSRTLAPMTCHFEPLGERQPGGRSPLDQKRKSAGF
jgi:single-strand DNA-binding protein